MNNQRLFTYVIAKGDNLYHLSKKFETTVQSIMSHNPFINPYDLKAGSSINIFAGKNYSASAGGVKALRHNPEKEKGLSDKMRLAWSQHVYWTRMLLISIAQRLADQSDVTDRLLRNPKDIEGIFAEFYNKETASAIARLLTEHLIIGAELITALRDGQTDEAKGLDGKWHKNADEMVGAFSSINPFFKYDEMRDMLYKHLALTTEEVSMRLKKEYKKDIEAFDKAEKEALSMADYFTRGIIEQFPQMF